MALKRGIVELDNYDDNWVFEYEQEKEILSKVLKNKIKEIHHIGSTSIKGLKSKPIIDILILINTFKDIEKITKILKEYGYENRGSQGVNNRFFFAKGPESARTHYLHVVETKSNTYYNQLYFKKYLIENPRYIKEYCQLKEMLASKYASDRKMYTQGKDEFIKKIIKLAKEEYNH